MKEPKIDPEVLAAYLEGRLSGREKDEVTELLAADPASYSVASDVLATLDDLGEGARPSAIPPRASSAETSPLKWAVAAAIVFALVGASWVILARNTPLSPLDIASLVDPSDLRRFGPAWEEQGWSESRGAGRSSEQVRAYRLGVRLVDLEVALRSGDLEKAQVLAHRIRRLLESLEVAEPLLATYRDLLSEVDSGLAGRALVTSAEGAEMVGASVDSAYLRLGATVEGLRLRGGETDRPLERELSDLGRSPLLAEDDRTRVVDLLGCLKDSGCSAAERMLADLSSTQ